MKNNFIDLSIKFNEEEQQNNWDLQFQNWTTPNTTNKILEAYYYNTKKFLSKKSHTFIWEIMKKQKQAKID